MWETLTSNYVINVGVLSWAIAQFLKTVLTLMTTRKVRLERLVGSGGMPSSHSALATAVAVGMLRSTGFSSPEFALAAAFAMIVMYDAMGVRRAAGEQARLLNRIVFEFPELPWLSKEPAGKYVDAPIDEAGETVKNTPKAQDAQESEETEELLATENGKPLTELLGHTPFEVLGGLILGVVVALLVPMK